MNERESGGEISSPCLTLLCIHAYRPKLSSLPPAGERRLTLAGDTLAVSSEFLVGLNQIPGYNFLYTFKVYHPLLEYEKTLIVNGPVHAGVI